MEKKECPKPKNGQKRCGHIHRQMVFLLLYGQVPQQVMLLLEWPLTRTRIYNLTMQFSNERIYILPNSGLSFNQLQYHPAISPAELSDDWLKDCSTELNQMFQNLGRLNYEKVIWKPISLMHPST